MKYPNGFFREKPCRSCGQGFTPQNPAQLYCRVECRGRNSYYIRNYGITENDLQKMKEAQDHRCYLCGSEGFIIGRNGHHEKLAVDHCHTSGRVRKLLCHNCNRGLGSLQEDPDLLRRAADYIEAHREGATTIP